MILSREYKERIILLEYENKRMAKRIKEIEKLLPPIMPAAPEGRVIVHPQMRDISYDTLRKKYRKYDTMYETDI